MIRSEDSDRRHSRVFLELFSNHLDDMVKSEAGIVVVHCKEVIVADASPVLIVLQESIIRGLGKVGSCDQRQCSCGRLCE